MKENKDYQMIDECFEKESHAYENDYSSGEQRDYTYYALNEFYGKMKRNCHDRMVVLGYGAADGKELERIADHCKRICIVDPTNKMKNKELNGVHLEYFEPRKDGIIDFQDNTFDLITCFGVLMYIMNPKKAIEEMIRVLKPGGRILIREPSTDMHVAKEIKRKGMGERTRGLPPSFYRKTLKSMNSIKYRMAFCMFSPWVSLGVKTMKAPLNHTWFVAIDSFLCKLFKNNWKYQRNTIWDKFSPGSIFLTIQKTGSV